MQKLVAMIENERSIKPNKALEIYEISRKNEILNLFFKSYLGRLLFKNRHIFILGLGISSSFIGAGISGLFLKLGSSFNSIAINTLIGFLIGSMIYFALFRVSLILLKKKEQKLGYSLLNESGVDYSDQVYALQKERVYKASIESGILQQENREDLAFFDCCFSALKELEYWRYFCLRRFAFKRWLVYYQSYKLCMLQLFLIGEEYNKE